MTENLSPELTPTKSKKNILILVVAIVIAVVLGTVGYLFVLPMVVGAEENVTVEPAMETLATDPSLDMTQNPELKPDLSVLDTQQSAEGVMPEEMPAPEGAAEIFKPEGDAVDTAPVAEEVPPAEVIPEPVTTPSTEVETPEAMTVEETPALAKAPEAFDEMAAIKRCGENFDNQYKAKKLDPLKFAKERGDYLEKCVTFLKEKQPK